MGQVTMIIPKSYFVAFEKAAKEIGSTITEWVDSSNNCCEVTVDGISDLGELVMLGVRVGQKQFQSAYESVFNPTFEEANKVLDNALKQLNL